jgi:chemotaxis protein MotB
VKGGHEEANPHELVLIRRRAGGDDAPHKGGVWKIAYADFMTAMMAFFLVMWLINSTDQRVLTQVANYFNPMRLTDSTPHSRGLNSIESGEQGKQGKQSSVGDPKDRNHAKDKEQEKSAEGRPAPKSDANEDAAAASTTSAARYTEQALFSDPYGILARIAAQAPNDAAAPSGKTTGAGSDVYRDPFDPATQNASRQKLSGAKAKAGPQSHDTASEPSGREAKANKDAKLSGKVAKGAEKEAAPSATDAKAPRDNTTSETAVSADNASDPAATPEAMRAAKQAAAEKALHDAAAKIEQDIKRAASQLKGTVPNIDVTVTDDGVLISITDDYDFGMFAIASAEPLPAMVVIMEKIAKVVQTYPQPVTVRGHTDGRPYRSGTYDNWRLSTARAHMAYYMLVRGGVDEKRFERVEGYADRSLRVPGDPEAAQNRRIEILLRRPKP